MFIYLFEYLFIYFIYVFIYSWDSIELIFEIMLYNIMLEYDFETF